jgi:sugar O-acyltransferase (sialic acid O-acetyltransferase NeuD family)
MPKTQKLVILGVEEIANLAYEYFTYDSDYEVVAFAVNREYLTGDNFRNLPVVAFEDLPQLYPPEQFACFAALSSSHLNRDRMKMYAAAKTMGYEMASYVSSHAFVWHNVEIGDNAFILEHNVLQPFVKIGNNVTLWSGNHIGHQSQIGDNCFIASHVVISGFCEIGESCFIGVNAAIANHIKIAKDNFLGMSAAVNQNTQENQVCVGNPSRIAQISATRFCKVK